MGITSSSFYKTRNLHGISFAYVRNGCRLAVCINDQPLELVERGLLQDSFEEFLYDPNKDSEDKSTLIHQALFTDKRVVSTIESTQINRMCIPPGEIHRVDIITRNESSENDFEPTGSLRFRVGVFHQG